VNAVERMRAKRATAPKSIGQLVVKDSRHPALAHFYPVYYWDRGTITVGVLQHPDKGHPVSYEAWQVLCAYAARRPDATPEQPGTLPMTCIWDLVSDAVKATWDATVDGLVDTARALSIFELRQQKQRVEPVKLESGLKVYRFNKATG
jgi:hypothetical protein